jgi:hypothetical protein
LTSAERAKDRRLQKTYKITLDDWNMLLAEQKYECAICSRPFAPKKDKNGKSFTPQQDHFHGCCPRRLKEFCGRCNRSALCFPCNKFVMGVIERLNIPVDKLAAYIVKWEKELRAKGCYDKKETKAPAKRKKARLR